MSIWGLLVCPHIIRDNCGLTYVKVSSGFCKSLHSLSLFALISRHVSSRHCCFTASSLLECSALSHSHSSRIKDGLRHGRAVFILCGTPAMQKSRYNYCLEISLLKLLIDTSRSLHPFLNINQQPGHPSSWIFNSSFSFSPQVSLSASANYVTNMYLSSSILSWRAISRE